MTGPSDLLLVSRAADGDIAAFEVLVRRHQVPVYRLCLGILGHRADAEDAAQDTFFTAWRAVGRFRGDAKVSTWLYRIATNRCLKHLGRRPTTTAELSERPGSLGNPEAEYEATQQLREIGAAVALLTPEQRIPLLLREVEDLPYNEIADILGVSVAAVKSRLNRGRTELARSIQADS